MQVVNFSIGCVLNYGIKQSFVTCNLSQMLSLLQFPPMINGLIKEGETLPYDCFSTVHVGLVGMAGDVLLNCVSLNDYKLILQAHPYVYDTINC